MGSEIDAISRFAGRTAPAASSWYFGAVVGPSPYAYDAAEASASFPAGGTLSPGAANTPAPGPRRVRWDRPTGCVM